MFEESSYDKLSGIHLAYVSFFGELFTFFCWIIDMSYEGFVNGVFLY